MARVQSTTGWPRRFVAFGICSSSRSRTPPFQGFGSFRVGEQSVYARFHGLEMLHGSTNRDFHVWVAHVGLAPEVFPITFLDCMESV